MSDPWLRPYPEFRPLRPGQKPFDIDAKWRIARATGGVRAYTPHDYLLCPSLVLHETTWYFQRVREYFRTGWVVIPLEEQLWLGVKGGMYDLKNAAKYFSEYYWEQLLDIISELFGRKATPRLPKKTPRLERILPPVKPGDV